VFKRKYGWLPDIPDQRDFLYSAVMKIPRVLPDRVDLTGYCSPVEDQGQLGSCTANALAGVLEYLDKRDDNAYTDQSRLFIYYNERFIEHKASDDSGAMLRDGIKSLAKWGSCPEQLWPYRISDFAKKPPAKCYSAATNNSITSYHRLATLDEMKACLASGYPFVFGFAVYESFETQLVARTGSVNMPKRSERMIGGHAVAAVGYNEKQKRFLVRNSWGDKWGMAGYFTMPYEYLEPGCLSSDFWVILR